MKDDKAIGKITPTINDDVNLEELTREVIRKVQGEIEMRERTLRNFQNLVQAEKYTRGMSKEEVEIQINKLDLEIQQLEKEEKAITDRERQDMMQDRIMPDSQEQLEEIQSKIQSNQEKKEEIRSEQEQYKTIQHNPFRHIEVCENRLKELKEQRSRAIMKDEPEGAYGETYEANPIEQETESVIRRIGTLYAELDELQQSDMADSDKLTVGGRIRWEIGKLTTTLNEGLDKSPESETELHTKNTEEVMQINQEIDDVEKELRKMRKDIQALNKLQAVGEVSGKMNDHKKRTGFFEVAEDGVITLKTYSDMQECSGKVVDKYIIYPKEEKIYLKMEQTGGIQTNMKQLTDKEDLYRMHNEFKVCNAVCVASDALRNHNYSHRMLRRGAYNYRNGFVSMLRKPHSREMLYNQDHLSIIRSAAGALNKRNVEYGNIGRFDSCFGPSIKEQKKTARKVERKAERKMTQRLRQEKEGGGIELQDLSTIQADKERSKSVQNLRTVQVGKERSKSVQNLRTIQADKERSESVQNLSTGQVGREKSRNKNRKKTIGSCIQQ